MRTKSPWSPGALLIVIGRTEEPQAEYCLVFLTFACDFLLAARLTRRRCMPWTGDEIGGPLPHPKADGGRNQIQK